MAKMPMELSTFQFESGHELTDSNGEIEVTFTKPFPTNPTVVCTPIAQSGIQYLCVNKNVSTTGFKSVSKRADSGTTSSAGNDVYWFAVTGYNN